MRCLWRGGLLTLESPSQYILERSGPWPASLFHILEEPPMKNKALEIMANWVMFLLLLQ